MMGSPFWSDVRSTGNNPNRRVNTCFFCRSRYVPSKSAPVYSYPFISAYFYDGHGSATGSLIVCSSCHSLTLEDRKQPEIIDHPFVFVGFHKK